MDGCYVVLQNHDFFWLHSYTEFFAPEVSICKWFWAAGTFCKNNVA